MCLSQNEHRWHGAEARSTFIDTTGREGRAGHMACGGGWRGSGRTLKAKKEHCPQTSHEGCDSQGLGDESEAPSSGTRSKEMTKNSVIKIDELLVQYIF